MPSISAKGTTRQVLGGMSVPVGPTRAILTGIGPTHGTRSPVWNRTRTSVLIPIPSEKSKPNQSGRLLHIPIISTPRISLTILYPEQRKEIRADIRADFYFWSLLNSPFQKKTGISYFPTHPAIRALQIGNDPKTDILGLPAY
jgi:hypothetical protein